MKRVLIGVMAILGLMATSAAFAAPLKLKPANPQPSGLRSGLAVRYAYPDDVKSLDEARAALRAGSEAGRPLKGLDNRDTREGQPTLTSKQAFRVVASISGYVRFDKPGIYTIDFLTNDGLDVQIGGKQVGLFNGRQPCDTTFATEVEVPVAGWYPLKAVYFQRLGTSCLHMRMAPAGSEPDWMPNSAFGY